MSLILIGTKRFHTVCHLTDEISCPRCHQLVIYSYVRTKRWLTYFFIPFLPLSTMNELMCPVCSNSIAISSGEARSARRGELKLSCFDNDNPSDPIIAKGRYR